MQNLKSLENSKLEKIIEILLQRVNIQFVYLHHSAMSHTKKVTICTTRFNVHKFYVLPTQCVYVLCMDLRTNSDYFSIQP
jgi:hypothetical protein